MPPRSFEFYNYGPVRLHRNTPWERIFREYTPFADGDVYIATYSFSPDVISVWARLLPFFQLTVAPGPRGSTRYRASAVELAKRHPLAEVRTAQELHTKAAFFAGTGRLFVGSQNFFSRRENFDETIVELRVPPDDRDRVADEVFASIAATPVVPIHDVGELFIHSSGFQQGYPHLLCHRTVQFWDLTSPMHQLERTAEGWRIKPGFQYVPGRLYMVSVYEHGGATSYLAFSRGYSYSGDLTPGAYEWLLANCQIKELHEPGAGWAWAGGLTATSPPKDHMLRIHPATQAGPPVRSVFFEQVRDWKVHRAKLRPEPVIDLTRRMLLASRTRAPG